MIIYKITNILNGKVYIGQTIRTLEERWAKHLSEKSGCLGIKFAIKKYGAENFKIEQIDHASTLDELNEKESFWIANIGSLSPNGYNLTTGGNQPRLCQESINKMANSLKGRKLSKEHIEKISARVKKYVVSPETKQKLSRALKGKTSWAKGRKFTAEHKAKISAALMGKSISNETKKKLSNYFKGFMQSQETINKRIKTQKANGHFPCPPKPIKCIENQFIYKSIREASIQLNLKASLISKVLKGKRTHTGHFTFEYINYEEKMSDINE